MKLKKHKGQHLLTDKNMLKKIADAVNITKDNNILEIGAGTGLLTGELVKQAGRVVSLEVDRDLEPGLREMESIHDNLEILIHDFLKWDLRTFLINNAVKWRVAANIPYNITSPIIEKLIMESPRGITDAHILMQKEVALRIISPPGTPQYGRLSVFVQYFAHAKIIHSVPPSVFIPPPKVDSALIHLAFKTQEELSSDIPFQTVFFQLVNSAFSQRRKQLHKALRGEFSHIAPDVIKKILSDSKIDPCRRGETLSLEEFSNITRKFMEFF